MSTIISPLSDPVGSFVAELSLFNLFFSLAVSSFLHSFIWTVLFSFTHTIVYSLFHSFSQWDLWAQHCFRCLQPDWHRPRPVGGRCSRHRSTAQIHLQKQWLPYGRGMASWPPPAGSPSFQAKVQLVSQQTLASDLAEWGYRAWSFLSNTGCL